MQIKKQYRFILVNLVSPKVKKDQAVSGLEELKQLVETFGGVTIVRVIQRRDFPHRNSYIGPGKIAEIAQIVKSEKINGVVINDTVKPTQLFELEKMLWKVNQTIVVWDRIDLILNIFDKHALTKEAKLQIALARMRHMGPRVFGMGYVLSRQGGGIGTRGIGETNTELMRRHWQREMKKIYEQLNLIIVHRENQMRRRQAVGLQTVAIIGYTNAGKSTLFNGLTGKKKLVENALFATLDSAVGKLYLPSLTKEILISDTIGFIQKLPPQLIDAFKSTLIESVYADILLHVIDISDEQMENKIAVVDQILRELGVSHKPQVYVFNKVDRAQKITQAKLKHIFDQYGRYNPQFISAKTGEGFAGLTASIEAALGVPKSKVTMQSTY